GGVESAVELPELALRGGGPPGARGAGRVLAVDGHVPPFDTELAGLDVLLDELRLEVAAELGAEGAPVVGELDHDHGCVDGAHRQRVARLAPRQVSERADLVVAGAGAVLLGDRRRPRVAPGAAVAAGE